MRRIAWVAMVVVLAGGLLARADYYATKADYRNGVRSAEPPSDKAGSDNCAAPTEITGPLQPFVDAGNTTGAANNVRAICTGGDCTLATAQPCGANVYVQVAGPDHVYEFSVTAGNDLTFSLSTTLSSYDPAIYILRTCDAGNTCVIGKDQCYADDFDQPPGCSDSTETIFTTLSPGTYYFYIDSFYSNAGAPARAQGPYELTVSGNLPVELLQFDIE